MTTNSLQKFLVATGVIIGSLIVLVWLLQSLGFLGERPEPRNTKDLVLEQGDRLAWLGMQIVPVSRVIRAEFNIPGKIKGMFIIDEGNGPAKKYGLKTGDVIVSIGRKAVPSTQAFVNAANNVQYYDGILLDIYRDGKRFYATVPFEYQYGPLYGPNKGSWQLGSPLAGQSFRYGRVFSGNQNNRNR